jgi:hypothetical protein
MSSQNLALQYQQKTDKQHILDNPDTYIGSVETVDSSMWVYDEAAKTIDFKNIEYNPGLYKLFDEAVVNARDHVEAILFRGRYVRACIFDAQKALQFLSAKCCAHDRIHIVVPVVSM